MSPRSSYSRSALTGTLVRRDKVPIVMLPTIPASPTLTLPRKRDLSHDALMAAATTQGPESRLATVLLYGGAAAAAFALHLATNGNLGFHTDELYYLDCGRHPAFGYVDFPPIVPLLARLETGLLGVTPWALRILPGLLSGLLVALFGAYVRRLGGSLWVQAIALIAGIAAPYIVGSGDVYQTVIFDIAAGIALLIWAPNLAWQVVNGFPTVAYVANHQGSGGGIGVYLLEFGLYVALLLPVWIAGLISIFRSRRLRPIGIASVVPLVLFLFVGKSYYAAATIPVVMAQGLMALSRLERPRLRTTLNVTVVVASVLTFAALAQLTLPITPASQLHATGLDTKSEVFADSVGWDDIASQVTQIYRNLPASQRTNTVIISAYYGVPGALHIYGDPTILPDVISPQLSDWYWLPPHLTATSALMVDYTPSDVAWMCDSPELIAHLTVPYQVVGLEQGAPVTFCQLKAPIATIWGRLRNFS